MYKTRTAYIIEYEVYEKLCNCGCEKRTTEIGIKTFFDFGEMKKFVDELEFRSHNMVYKYYHGTVQEGSLYA